MSRSSLQTQILRLSVPILPRKRRELERRHDRLGRSFTLVNFILLYFLLVSRLHCLPRVTGLRIWTRLKLKCERKWYFESCSFVDIPGLECTRSSCLAICCRYKNNRRCVVMPLGTVSILSILVTLVGHHVDKNFRHEGIATIPSAVNASECLFKEVFRKTPSPLFE